MDEQLLKELMNLQAAYKNGFDLVHQRLVNQSELLAEAEKRAQQTTEHNLALKELLEEEAAERDAQVQKLIKITAALTVIAEQITQRFSVQE